MNVFWFEYRVELALWFILLIMKAFALCDAVVRKDASYVAADKQNKAFWLLMLVIFLVLHVLLRSPIQILNLIGTVAALVYLTDVRPTLRAMRQH